MNHLKALIRTALALAYVGSDIRIVGPAIHPTILGSVGLVLLTLAGLPVNALTAVLSTAALYAVEDLLGQYSES